MRSERKLEGNFRLPFFFFERSKENEQRNHPEFGKNAF